MRSIVLALTAASLAAPLVAAPPPLGDFRLPSDPSPQDQPARQGPVAPDVPESRRAPTPTPTPAPTASVPPPAPEIVLPPVTVVPPPAATPDAPASEAAPTRSRPVPVPAATVPPAPVSGEAAMPTAAVPPSVATPSPVPIPTARAETESGRRSPWPWLLGVLLALGALGAGAWAWTLRPRRTGPAKVPEIERPRIVPAARPAPAPAAVPPPSAGEPLQVALEPLRLSVTLMNAALAWRLRVTNGGTAPLTALTIGADMISAHASMSREEQLSGPGGAPLAVQRIERLAPGESRTLEGEFRLPLGQIVPIRQGKAALLLPLARFRVEAKGAKALVRTFAVGQPGNGSGLQPFRLDQGPRVYPRLTQRAFA